MRLEILYAFDLPVTTTLLPYGQIASLCKMSCLVSTGIYVCDSLIRRILKTLPTQKECDFVTLRG